MAKVKGIVVYSIESNGCLNGVYSNTGLTGEVYNEIARVSSRQVA